MTIASTIYSTLSRKCGRSMCPPHERPTVKLVIERLEERSLMSGDGFGSTFATATPLVLASDGSILQRGITETAGSTDMFQFKPTKTESLAVELDAAAGSFLNPVLSAYDGSQSLIATNDDIGGATSSVNGNTNSRFTIGVMAGQTYYLKVEGTLGTTGNYILTAAPYTDDVPNTLAAAQTITLAPDGTATQHGTIEVAGDVDYYEFTYNGTTSGLITVHQNASAGSSVDSFLTVYDGSQNFYTSNDDSSGSLDSTVNILAFPGQTFYLEAGTFSPLSTGGYDLEITTSAESSTSFANPVLLQSDSSDRSSSTYGVDNPGDLYYYSLTAQRSGNLTISVTNDQSAANPLNPTLAVYDSSENLLASNDDFGGTVNSLVTVPVTTGQSYFIVASGVSGLPTDPGTVGVFTVTTSHDDYGNYFDVAHPIVLAKNGSATVSGNIETQGDSDYFSLVSPVSGMITVRQQAFSGSSLDSQLTAYNFAHNQITFNDDSDGSFNSRVQFVVTAGETYYLNSHAYQFSTGDYQLSIVTTPDVPSNFARPLSLPLDFFGNAQVTAAIVVPGESNTYSFTSTHNGVVSIGSLSDFTPGQNPYAGATYPLDSNIAVYGNSYSLLGSGDSNNPVSLNVVAGETYYIQISASLDGPTTGVYLLNLETATSDPVADTFDAATYIPLASDGSGAVLGVIPGPYVRNMYSVVTPLTGKLIIDQNAYSNSSLDSLLRVYDGAGRLIAINDNSTQNGFSVNSRLEIDVDAGQQYYVEAGGAGSSAGTYLLAFSLVLPVTISPITQIDLPKLDAAIHPAIAVASTKNADSNILRTTEDVGREQVAILQDSIASTVSIADTSIVQIVGLALKFEFVTSAALPLRINPDVGKSVDVGRTVDKVEQGYSAQVEAFESETSNYEVVISLRSSDLVANGSHQGAEQASDLIDAGLPILVTGANHRDSVEGQRNAPMNASTALVILPELSGAFLPAYHSNNGSQRHPSVWPSIQPSSIPVEQLDSIFLEERSVPLDSTPSGFESNSPISRHLLDQELDFDRSRYAVLQYHRDEPDSSGSIFSRENGYCPLLIVSFLLGLAAKGVSEEYGSKLLLGRGETVNR